MNSWEEAASTTDNTAASSRHTPHDADNKTLRPENKKIFFKKGKIFLKKEKNLSDNTSPQTQNPHKLLFLMAATDISQHQVQQQTEALQQRLSAQQLMVARLLELTTPELEDRVRAELNDNPALGELTDGDEPDSDGIDAPAERETPDDDSDDELRELDGEPNGNDTADYDDYDDSSDTYTQGSPQGTREEIPFDAGRTFYDELQEQLRESPLTAAEQEIGLYILGSLDDDGLLHKDFESLCDELAFNQGINASPDEVHKVLRQIQQFDPAGIGAQSTQECLLIQLERGEQSTTHALKHRILTDCFDDFINNRWEHIAPALQADDNQVADACRELARLNPRPGSSLEETMGKGLQQVVPDFFLDTEGTLWLNDEHMPVLRISKEYNELMQQQKQAGTTASKDALSFLSRKIDNGRDFIQALRQRNKTMADIVGAIVRIQHDYCREGFDSLLVPMTLKTVAEQTGYDVSTISRVTNNKYIQTPFGLIPLKHFFSNRQVRVGGNDSQLFMQSGPALQALKSLVDKENKTHPLNDSELAEQMKNLGYEVARRTVAKYRTQLGIPTAPLRKKQ